MYSNSFPAVITICITFQNRVIDRKGEKGATGLSKPNVYSILLPMEIDGNDAVLPEREKYNTNHPFKKCTH